MKLAHCGHLSPPHPHPVLAQTGLRHVPTPRTGTPLLPWGIQHVPTPSTGTPLLPWGMGHVPTQRTGTPLGDHPQDLVNGALWTSSRAPPAALKAQQSPPPGVERALTFTCTAGLSPGLSRCWHLTCPHSSSKEAGSSLDQAETLGQEVCVDGDGGREARRGGAPSPGSAQGQRSEVRAAGALGKPAVSYQANTCTKANTIASVPGDESDCFRGRRTESTGGSQTRPSPKCRRREDTAAFSN